MTEKKLNIGAGDFPISGFINLDVYKYPGVDLICNATKLPFENNSIDEIYCGHCIEHNTNKEVKKILKECLRVLKPGCHIGIVIPEKNFTPKQMLIGSKFPNEPYKEHHTFWNLHMLKEEVSKTGFVDVETMNIDTYPHLVARPKWQVGVVAYKKGKKETPTFPIENIPKFNEREYSWCKHEKKVIYNPSKKKHCSSCGGLL